MKKYTLIEIEQPPMDRKLYQIQALTDFTAVNGMAIKAGDLGGFISGEHNLSHEGTCWVANNAKVYDEAEVFYDAFISDNAIVRNRAKVFGSAQISGSADIGGSDTIIFNNTSISGSVRIGNQRIGKIEIYNNVQIFGMVQIEGDCYLSGDVQISGNSSIEGSVRIENKVKICDASIRGSHWIRHNAQIIGPNVTIYGGVGIKENAKIINADPKKYIEIGGDGEIGSNALIQSQNDILQSRIFSDFLEYFTAYKTEKGFEIRYNDQSFSAEQIRKALNAYSEYETAVNIAKSRILGGL